MLDAGDRAAIVVMNRAVDEVEHNLSDVPCTGCTMARFLTHAIRHLIVHSSRDYEALAEALLVEARQKGVT